MNRKASHGDETPISSALDVTVLTDGRAGNRAQALGLAEALVRLGPATIQERTVVLRRPFDLMPAGLWHALRPLPGWPAMALRDGSAALAPLGPQPLLIGAGRRAAPIVAALARRTGAPSVQLLDPQIDPGAFSLVAAPAHDGLRAPNAVTTLGAVGRVTAESITAARAALPAALVAEIKALPRPRIGILLGGNSRSARWSAEEVEGFIAACRHLAAEGQALAITPSRRTDPSVIAALREALRGEGHYLWDENATNPYPGMLGLVDAVLVTADSVNMASEAAASGLPLHVFPIAHLDRKLRAFHDALRAQGASRTFEGRIEHWSYPPLAEADRLAAVVADRLLPDWPTDKAQPAPDSRGR
ncbi:MAG: mitochondrial fission ELM1 family protein [Pseudomonadota bacterium]